MSHADKQDDVRFYRDLLRAYFDSANDAIFVLCDEMKFLSCNVVMQQWLGRNEADLTRHNARVPVTELLGDARSAATLRAHFPAALAGQRPRFELRLATRDGDARWIEMSLSRVAVEAGDMVMVVARDVTDRHVQEQRARHHATHDVLTGLPNRSLFTEMLESALTWSPRGALLVFDINHFRDVNEHLGHAMGDLVLRTTAGRLAAFAGATPHARVGSNEFTVWLPDADEADARAAAASLRRAIVAPIGSELGDYSADITTGFALQPAHASDADSLLRSAEAGMYKAKSLRVPVAMFDPDENQRNAARLRLMSDLRRAIESGRIDVHYQPMISLRTSGNLRVEALARWNHPERGAIAPADFIQLSERMGSIHALTRLVMERAVSDCAPLIRAGQLEVLSINLSPLCLSDSSLVPFLGGLIEHHRLPVGALMIEITESAIMNDPEHASQILNAFHALGVELAVDDFGTGHSSLAKLRQFPVSEIKIDRAFVTNMHRNAGDAAIVRAALQLARTFDCRVVAEGIEFPEAQAMLSEYECDYGQGYLIARPMPRAALVDWLTVPR